MIPRQVATTLFYVYSHLPACSRSGNKLRLPVPAAKVIVSTSFGAKPRGADDTAKKSDKVPGTVICPFPRNSCVPREPPTATKPDQKPKDFPNALADKSADGMCPS